MATLSEPEVLEPIALVTELTTKDANDEVTEELKSSHIADRQTRNADTFRMLSGLFWESNPLRPQMLTPAEKPENTAPAAEEEAWRRALVQTAPPRKLMV